MTTLAVDLALRSYEGSWNRVRWEQLPDVGPYHQALTTAFARADWVTQHVQDAALPGAKAICDPH